MLNGFVAGLGGGSCNATGVALWSEPAAPPQRTTILANGTLVFGNQAQYNIQPVLTQNGINVRQFVTARNTVQLDLDNDGVIETLTIEQPVPACY